ncbi:MAG: mercuric reductase [Planctomycetes bacterium]|nr:mercuric reductase [Planctomycetota bacterium]
MTDEHVRVQPRDPYNLELLAHVHPEDWINPAPVERYNLVVIGAGTAGLITAAGSAGLAARVALVERALMGGDCLNFGCVPSKGLIAASRVAATVRDAGEFGIEVPPGTQVNFGAVMERMRRLRAEISRNDSAQRYRDLGVDVYLGTARFTGRDTLVVGERTLRFKKAVIATGGRAARPPIPGLEATGFLTNESVFSLTELPRRLAVIGAGPIGCELAPAFARFGAEVTLIGNHDRILPREDRSAAEIVQKRMARDGVRLMLDCEVLYAERQGSGKVLFVRGPSGESEVPADEVLVGVGRSPNVEGLGLEEAGVAYDTRVGIHVDDRLRTSNRHIFAAGDVCSRFKFTHAADAMARIAIQNALFLGRAKVSALTIPWCTYTDPEVAHVGLYKDEAAAQGIAVETFEQDLHHVDRAILDGEGDGFVKVHVRKGTDRIVGASIVARHAGEMISEITAAMVARGGLKTLARTIHPYPTQAEGIKRVADAYNRTRLTPLVRWLFGKWLSWTQ